MKIAINLLSALVLTSQALGQTNVSGLISNDTTWSFAGSPYIVIGNILVNAGVKLTIEPGVTIRFNSGKSLQVNGQLLAQGSLANWIVFTSNQSSPSPGDWSDIILSPANLVVKDSLGDTTGNYLKATEFQPPSTLQYCIISYAGNGNGDAIRLIQGSAHILNSIIEHTAGYGILCDGDAQFDANSDTIRFNQGGIYDGPLRGGSSSSPQLIETCYISQNSGEGIFVGRWKLLSIIGSIIARNGNSGIITWEGEGRGIYITQNIIADNQSTSDGGGIQILSYYGSHNIDQNIFFRNHATGNGGAISWVNQYGDDGFRLTRNTIAWNTASGGGSGLSCQFQFDLSIGSIDSNLFVENLSPQADLSFSGAFPVKFQNNNFVRSRSKYDLYNDNQNGTTVVASNNWWGSNADSGVQATIYDFFDNGSKGVVNYIPFLSKLDIGAPISPPVNVTKEAIAAGVTLNWAANVESDLKGYNVYYGSSDGYTYLHKVDVGNVTAFTLNGVSVFDSIAVTAYDQVSGGVNDQFDGHESWFSSPRLISHANLPPVAAQLRDTIISNLGRNLSVRLQYTSAGSNDPDGKIIQVSWYVNGVLKTHNQDFAYDFRQGTNQLTLVVQDDSLATDSSTARVKVSSFITLLKGPIYGGLSLLGDSLLYAVASGDAVYRLNTDGTTVYNLQVNGQITSASSISPDTVVYIGSSDKNLYAFSKNGAPAWPPLPLGGELSATPTVDTVLNRLYIGVTNGNFFGIDRSNGHVVWTFLADAPIKNSAVLTYDRKLMVATIKGTVYSFDLASSPTPSQASSSFSVGDTITTSPAIDFGGNFYVGTNSGKILKLANGINGHFSVAWAVTIGTSILASPVIDLNGSLYIGGLDGKIYSINTQSGSINWTFKTGGPIRSTAALSNSGYLYIGNDAGELIALDASGKEQWFYKADNSISAPVLYNGGSAYVGTEGGFIISIFDDADSSLNKMTSSSAQRNFTGSEMPWGTFQGNNQRTGAQRLTEAAVASIYPGDANNDGIVDERDLLPIGRFYGITGTPRQGGSANWSKQGVTSPWNPFDACYADCDGNGTVDAQDVTVIIQNWYATRSSASPMNVDRRAVAEFLLKEIDGQPQSETMKAIRGSIVAYMQEKLGVVFTFALEQNYPNPFNPSTTIQFVLPASAPSSTLKIYNIIGQLVWERDFGTLDAGTHFVEWDGNSSRGLKVASGFYIYRLESGSQSSQHRMLLLK